MNTGLRLSLIAGLVALVGSMLLTAPAGAQDQREIDLIAELGKEEIARRAAAAQAAEEAAHKQLLEEQSRLRAVYAEYLGEARRAAQRAVAIKRKSANAEQIDAFRREARIIIDEVTPETKARVPAELDPIYEKLEQMLAVSSADLITANPDLGALRKRLSPGSGSDLDWVDESAILYALCEDKAGAEVIAGNIPHREKLSKDEAEAIDLCNRRRIVLGLNPLAIDMQLVECSRDHSNDMVTLNFFAHESPVEGKKTPWDRAKNFGTSASGENIAAGYNNGRAVTIGWWYSPGHLQNMMGRGHLRIGLGQKNQHYTQMFGR